MPRLLTAIIAVAIATPALADDWKPSEAEIRAHVSFLASDAMKGREAGTPEYDIAAQYVASQFEALGLTPAGDKGSYLQTVPLVLARPADEGKPVLTVGGKNVPLVFGTDYLPGASPLKPELTVDAPLIFAGYGVVAPSFGRDDYKGLDVRGKIVVLLAGAPATISTEERAHYGNGTTKRKLAADKGAVGVLTIYTPTREKVLPFARAGRTWKSWGATWAHSDGTPEYPGATAPGVGALSLAAAQKLFAGVPGGADAVYAAADTKTFDARKFRLAASLNATYRTEIRREMSSNVAGLLPGSDPALAAETIVLSAHLDHVGVGNAVNGDTIYNGAMDNAVGIASMIEVAHAFKHSGTRPKRGILFLAVTAEEKGLVGADYFAQNPTIPKTNLVANVNLDMPIITYDFVDVVAFGAPRSSLGPTVEKAAATLGVKLVPDPEPEQGIFTRSDHYRFVQQGIPSVFLVTGPGGDGKAAGADFVAKHYHQPSDDLTRPIRWDAGVKFVQLNTAIARELADAPARPRWNKGDFFGTLFGGFGAK
jgi:Zn-dependent M28 family amino/carboxypeptidase